MLFFHTQECIWIAWIDTKTKVKSKLKFSLCENFLHRTLTQSTPAIFHWKLDFMNIDFVIYSRLAIMMFFRECIQRKIYEAAL